MTDQLDASGNERKGIEVLWDDGTYQSPHPDVCWTIGSHSKYEMGSYSMEWANTVRDLMRAGF